MENFKMENVKETQLYSNKILDVYVALIREKYFDIDIENLMDEAGIGNCNEASNNAFALYQTQLNRFHERLCILTDNMKIARQAGRYAVAPQCLGLIRSLVLPFAGVRLACKMMVKYAGRRTRAVRYSVRYIKKNKLEIVVTPNEGIKEEPFQCEIRQGYFQGLEDVFLHNELTVSHPECIFKEGKACRYEFAWRYSAFPLFAGLSWLAGIAAAAMFIAFWFPPFADVFNPLWMFCPALLFPGLGWAAQREKSKAFLRSLRGIHTAKEEILHHRQINAENSKAIADIGQALGIEDPDACIFNRAANIAGRKLGYDRVMIMIANDEKTFLAYRGGYGFTAVENIYTAEYRINLEGPSEGVFCESFRQNKPILVNDMEWLKQNFFQIREMADRIKPRSFVVCPIDVDGTPIGILIAGNTVTLRKLDQNDTHLVMAVAQQIGCVYKRQMCEKQQVEFKRQIVQLQKMEALGVLAGGISHDFNNILSPIIGYTDLCLTLCPKDSKMFEYLRRVKNAAGRAQDLVAQILAFNRQGEREYIRCHPGTIIKESLKLLRASVPKEIKIEMSIAQDIAPVMADPTQIHQLIMNLCTNAYHAMMEKGGVMTVRLDEMQVKKSALEETGRLLPGFYVHIQVEDTGHGMSRAVMDNIFEPYFTTKIKGRGAGMGLPIVKGIVAQLKGHIFVDSIEGKGSCFDIYLPRAGENKSEQQG